MTNVPPPEPPTRRIDPVAPPPVYEERPVYQERVVEPAVAPVDPNLMFVRLEDAISSLRTGLIFVGVLTVLAIGLAIYAITQTNDNNSNGTRAGASSQRVATLDDRIDRLSRQVQQARADARAARALTTRIDSLSRSVSALRAQGAGGGAAASQVASDITALDKRLTAVEQQVQDLKANPTTTP
jgi:polyhydroxyalkanoate synthesis regulator phasin